MELNLRIITSFLFFTSVAIASNFAISLAQEAVFDRDTLIRLLEVNETYAQGEPIKVTGNVYNITTNAYIANFKVVIKVLDGDDVLFMGSEESDSRGNFEYTSPPVLAEGNNLLTIAVGNGLHDDAVVTITAKQTEEETIQNSAALGVIIATLAIAFALFYFSQRVTYYTICLFGGFGAIVAGYIVLFSYPPFTDDAINTAFGAALIAPIATIGIDYIKNKQEFEKERLRTAVGYRDEKLKSEVELLGRFLNEVADHYVILKDEEFKPLGCSMKKSPTVGTMANLPTAWLKQYYQCISDYNDILLDKTKEDNESISEDLKRLKETIEGMQNMIYFNLSYNIILLQKRFLSVPSVETPTRYNTTLLDLIWKSKILEKNINHFRFERKCYDKLEYWETRKKSKEGFEYFYSELRKTLETKVNIYTEQNAYELMHHISDEFKEDYKVARELISKIASPA